MFKDISKVTRMKMMSVSEHKLTNHRGITSIYCISDYYPYLKQQDIFYD